MKRLLPLSLLAAAAVAVSVGAQQAPAGATQAPDAATKKES